MPRIIRTPEASRVPADPCAGSPPLATDEGQESGASQPSPERTEVVGTAEHYAGHLRESTASLFHSAVMANAFKGIDAQAFKIYRDRLLVDCGGPTDPIEIMIVEQLSLAHFSLGVLSCKANNATRFEATAVYSGAAARLMGEFRRSALALQAYRAASRQLAMVSPEPAIDLPGESADHEDAPEKIHEPTEMGSTRRDSDEERPVIPISRAASV